MTFAMFFIAGICALSSIGLFFLLRELLGEDSKIILKFSLTCLFSAWCWWTMATGGNFVERPSNHNPLHNNILERSYR